MFRRRRGQSTAEYAIVIGLVIAAAVAMQTYVKRGLQAKVKGVVDYKVVDEGTNIFTGEQFEPDYASSDITTTRTAKETTQMEITGEVIRSQDQDEVTTRSGSQTTSGLTETGAPIP